MRSPYVPAQWNGCPACSIWYLVASDDWLRWDLADRPAGMKQEKLPMLCRLLRFPSCRPTLCESQTQRIAIQPLTLNSLTLRHTLISCVLPKSSSLHHPQLVSMQSLLRSSIPVPSPISAQVLLQRRYMAEAGSTLTGPTLLACLTSDIDIDVVSQSNSRSLNPSPAIPFGQSHVFLLDYIAPFRVLG